MFLDSRLKNAIRKTKIISFDIFDTLLIRPYINPNDVFEELEEAYSIPGFAAARNIAEPNAWNDLVNKNKDDVTLDEIYNYMPEQFSFMKQKEIDFEKEHLHANPEMIDILNYALALNKQVIIVSDMYLSSKDLKQVLIRELKTNKFKLYVSSEFGKRKHTGNLFKYVLQDLNVKPSQILHIGDNKESDFNIPKKLGINAYLYIPYIKNFIKTSRVNEFFKWHNNLDSRRFIGTLSLMYQIYSHNKHVDYWNKLAFLYGGPLSYNYVNMIKKHATTDKLSDIYFVARDGYTLKKIFDIIEPKSKINTKYVYAPRFTNTLAYIDLGNKNVLNERKKVLLDFLIKQNIAQKSDNIEQHMNVLQKFSDKERKEYNKYINRLKAGKHVGVVDSISMSYSAQKLIAKNLPDSNVTGFYWWTVPAEGQNKPNLYQFYNGIYKPCFCHLIEFFFAAPEKPIHRINNGKPEYNTNIDKYEQIKIDLYPRISDAMIEFIKIAKQFNLNPIIDDVCMFDWMNYFVMFADKNDFKQFKNIKNGVDQSHTKYDPVLPELPVFNKPIKGEKWRKFKHVFYKRTKSKNGTCRVYIFGIRIIKYKK